MQDSKTLSSFRDDCCPLGTIAVLWWRLLSFGYDSWLSFGDDCCPLGTIGVIHVWLLSFGDDCGNKEIRERKKLFHIAPSVHQEYFHLFTFMSIYLRRKNSPFSDLFPTFVYRTIRLLKKNKLSEISGGLFTLDSPPHLM